MSFIAISLTSIPSWPSLCSTGVAVDRQSDALQGAAGTGTVAGNLTGALMELFGPVAEAVLGLVISRDGLRARLRQRGSTGVPILTEAAGMIASYLVKERELGRIRADADVDTLAPALIGAAHMLFAGRKGVTIEPGAVHKVVATVIAGVLSGPAARGGAETARVSPAGGAESVPESGVRNGP